jgi:hypothetical protein
MLPLQLLNQKRSLLEVAKPRTESDAVRRLCRNGGCDEVPLKLDNAFLSRPSADSCGMTASDMSVWPTMTPPEPAYKM